ncbi:alpha/beta fold hydrolase [Gudongella sp. DL1XJH-153]|uniref:alpha/beta fold hydrolase n=1 Tax=Gudongella sp. DL1XJH-153 TaxID=3409804 RepID=UPI003BB64DE0
MKPLMVFGIILASILAIVVILLFASRINHKNKLQKEAREFLPPGSIIEVDDNKIHVYATGEGETTLVFMAGHGTSSPTLDFKPLWSRLMDQYRIVVVEKSGYGWSDVSNSPRDIDTILEETRKSLDFAGEKGPYVLAPHSMSGLEAIYWAQKYPDEVKAIVGLDPSIPETVELLPEPKNMQLRLLYYIARIGLTRFMPESETSRNLPLMDSNDLSEEDKHRYKALFYKSTLTEDMLREVEYLKENGKTVEQGSTPKSIPMYFFISQQQDKRVNGWKDALLGYLSNIDTKKHMILDTEHYVHHDKSDLIAREIKAFLSEIE